MLKMFRRTFVAAAFASIPTATMIVVGDAFGAIRSSPDGITWTVRDSKMGSNTIHNIFYANGLFIAMGNTVLSTSPDGINWTLRTSGLSTGQLFDVVYSGAFFLAITYQGEVIKSTDGITWAKLTTTGLNSSTLNSIAFGNGKFVIGTGNGKLYSSVDGVTWVLRLDTFTNSQFSGVIYDGTSFVAVCNNLLKTSVDGVTWVAGTNTPIIPSAVRFVNGKYFLLTGDGNIYHSTNLINWTSLNINRNDIRDIRFFKNNYYIATSSYVYVIPLALTSKTAIDSTAIGNFHNGICTN